MATIKSYTDISQSKVLAEILPLESADMCYKCIGEDPYDVTLRPYSEWREEYKGLLVAKEVDVIPCWSLAALLSVLPNSIYDNTDEYSQLEFSKISVAYHDMNDRIKVGSIKDNLVDACYEMILKLHKLNNL